VAACESQPGRIYTAGYERFTSSFPVQQEPRDGFDHGCQTVQMYLNVRRVTPASPTVAMAAVSVYHGGLLSPSQLLHDDAP